MKLVVIADDFTGATDIASFLVENGLKTIQINDVPTMDAPKDIDACVVSLKSRSCPVHQAISQSLSVLDWAKKQGAEKFFFKYCSTFDSTSKGNIGPVTDALLDALGETATVVCPALPVNGRTVYKGYLFVGDVLLNESGMQNHPITPMKDANLLRLMEDQAQGKAALIDQNIVAKGSKSITKVLRNYRNQGKHYIVIDSICTKDLDIVAAAIYHEMSLFTGGSGLGGGLAKYIATSQASYGKPASSLGEPQKAETVILSGSCSLMTQAQVKNYQDKAPAFCLDVAQAIKNNHYPQEIAAWYQNNNNQPLAPLIYATTDAQALKEIQKNHGGDIASKAIENVFSALAKILQQQGVCNFIIAGGETSGAVVQSLNIQSFYIGPKIAPGVPWVKCTKNHYSLALKSGNFGDENFFQIAQDIIKASVH